MSRTTRCRTTESLRTNIQKHCIRRRPESGVMPHSTALDNHQLSVIQCMYTYTKATVLSTRLTSCKPYVPRKRICPKLTLSLSQLLLHSIQNWRPPKIGGPVRPNTSNMPNAGPAVSRYVLAPLFTCGVETGKNVIRLHDYASFVPGIVRFG